MRAMAIHETGQADKLQLIELDRPEPTGRDLLIEVNAVALNPVDYKVRSSGLGMDRQFPLVLGYDVCGTVVGLGPDCQRFKAGDLIYASPSIGRNGAYAQYVLVDERTAALKPETLSVVESAALPLVTLTAWESLHSRARMHPGETVFIQGGAGGVGHIALQLCRAHGNRTITTAGRDESIKLCKQCGADEVINYREADVVEQIKQLTDGQGVSVALDCVGGEALIECFHAIGINGRVVSIVHTKTDQVHELLFRKNATLHLEFMGVPPIYGINMESHGEILTTAAELADAGKLKPHVAKTITLEQIPDAHRELEDRHVTGKIVCVVGE